MAKDTGRLGGHRHHTSGLSREIVEFWQQVWHLRQETGATDGHLAIPSMDGLK